MNSDLKVHEQDRAGRLTLHGHYTNLSHRFTAIGADSSFPAVYLGQVSGGWFKFSVPLFGITVYARRVDGPANAYLTEEAFSKLMQ